MWRKQLLQAKDMIWEYIYIYIHTHIYRHTHQQPINSQSKVGKEKLLVIEFFFCCGLLRMECFKNVFSLIEVIFHWSQKNQYYHFNNILCGFKIKLFL